MPSKKPPAPSARERRDRALDIMKGAAQDMPVERTEAAGRAAYEADVAATPNYHDGTPRQAWEKLSDIARLSWRMNPTPRRPNPGGYDAKGKRQFGYCGRCQHYGADCKCTPAQYHAWHADLRAQAEKGRAIIAGRQRSPITNFGFTPDSVKIETALTHLRIARDLLKEAHAPNAANRARWTLKSAEGALRNAIGHRDRPQRKHRKASKPPRREARILQLLRNFYNEEQLQSLLKVKP